MMKIRQLKGNSALLKNRFITVKKHRKKHSRCFRVIEMGIVSSLFLQAPMSFANQCWTWAHNANEQGYFITDDGVDVGGGITNYTINDFKVTATTASNVDDSSFGTNGVTGFKWNGTSPTQFWRDGGAYTNGANFYLPQQTSPYHWWGIGINFFRITYGYTGILYSPTTPTLTLGGVFCPDITAPTLSEVTAIPSTTNDSTPDYTFSSDEAGTISYGGDCDSSTTAAVVGNNTITFNSLADGTYSNCTITVTDASTNASTALSVSSFTVDTYVPDTTAPTLSEVTAIPSTTNDSTPDYTFSSDEAGTISYGGDCDSSTTAAVVGNNTITFNSLADGTYSNCTITVTDASTNDSTPLSVSSFTVDTYVAPPAPPVSADFGVGAGLAMSLAALGGVAAGIRRRKLCISN